MNKIDEACRRRDISMVRYFIYNGEDINIILVYITRRLWFDIYILIASRYYFLDRISHITLGDCLIQFLDCLNDEYNNTKLLECIHYTAGLLRSDHKDYLHNILVDRFILSCDRVDLNLVKIISYYVQDDFVNSMIESPMLNGRVKKLLCDITYRMI